MFGTLQVLPICKTHISLLIKIKRKKYILEQLSHFFLIQTHLIIFKPSKLGSIICYNIPEIFRCDSENKFCYNSGKKNNNKSPFTINSIARSFDVFEQIFHLHRLCLSGSAEQRLHFLLVILNSE